MSKAHHFPDRIRELPAFEGAFDARQLHGENCEVLFASYPAGMKIEPHEHGSENHGVVTAGELRMVVDGENRRYSPGDWYFLAAGQVHSASFTVDTSLIEFWFEAST
jgi:quercetin dioxygenase-like cupin family protein